MEYIVIIGALIAALNVWVAARQMQISNRQQQIMEDQHRHFLLERRHLFYDTMMRFVFEVQAYGKPRAESSGWNFLHQKRQAALLFGEPVQSLVDEIMRKYLEIVVLGDDQSKELKAWFTHAYYKTLPEYFAPFLGE
jgi:hypothetical protein